MLPPSLVPQAPKVVAFPTGQPRAGDYVVVKNEVTGSEELYEVTKGFGGTRHRVFDAGGMSFSRNGRCRGMLKHLSARPASAQDLQALAKSVPDAARLRQHRAQRLMNELREAVADMNLYVDALSPTAQRLPEDLTTRMMSYLKRTMKIARRMSHEWPPPVE